MNNEPTSTLPLGVVFVCIGFLAIDMRAYCFGCAVIFFGILFIVSNLIR